MKCVLTDKLIASHQLPPTVRREELCDQRVKGLYAEVRSTALGEASFYLRYKDPIGKTSHTKLGRSGEIDVAQACQRAKALKKGIAVGRDPQAEANAKKAVPTLRKFAQERYLAFVAARKRSWKNDKSMLELRILPAFGDRRLDQISRHQIETFHASLLDEGLSGASADHHVKTLRHLYNKAIQWSACTQNPAAGIQLFNFDNKKERYLSPEERRRLLEILRTDRNRVVCNVALLLISTGARLNEALHARWSDISRENRVWVI